MDGEVVLWALANQTLHELFGVFSLVSTVFLIMNDQLFFFFRFKRHRRALDTTLGWEPWDLVAP